MRVGSVPGLGWPEDRRWAGRWEKAELPAGSARAGSALTERGSQLPGLGWPGSGPGPGSEHRSEAVPVQPASPGPAGTDDQRRTAPPVTDTEDDAGQAPDSWGPPPDRLRRVLASVSRETQSGADIRPAVRSSTATTDTSGAIAQPAREPAGEMRSGPAADNVGGAGDGTGESEVQVAIPAVPDSVADTPIARAAQAAVVARAGGAPWPRPSACRIITIANQKGGVGKTTTAVNMAASLAMHGARVLVIDLDPQGNASTALDIDHHSGVPSVYNVLVDGQPLASVIKQVAGYPQLYCAPAAIDLAGAEIELVPLVARESRLERALAAYDASNLDYIFIDCPPSLGLLTVNALVAAPEVLIPIQCEYYALEGLEQLLRTVDLVRSHLNPGLSVTTILLTMYDGRTRLASQVADEVREHFGAIVLGSVIPRSVRVSEAPSYGQSVMTYDPGSTGALAYLEAARELAHGNAAPAVG